MPAAGRAAAGDAGADSRPVLIFLHGTRLNGGQWAAQIGALADEFRCLAPDLPGHGRNTDRPFTLESAATAVERLIDEQAGGRAVLIGLSLGSYVAMEVAARSPERVAGLVLAGGTAEPTGYRAVPYLGLAFLLGAIPDDQLARLNSWFFRRRYRPEIAEPIIAGGWGFSGGSVAVRALIGERFRPRLARYPGPSLLLNGEYDLLFRLFERSFADVAARPRRVMIRRATHLSNLDQPERFTAAVRAFARRL